MLSVTKLLQEAPYWLVKYAFNFGMLDIYSKCMAQLFVIALFFCFGFVSKC